MRSRNIKRVDGIAASLDNWPTAIIPMIWFAGD
jgi:hypothetical protein